MNLTVNGQQVKLDQTGKSVDIGPYVKAGTNTIECRVDSNISNYENALGTFGAPSDDNTFQFGIVGDVTVTPYIQTELGVKSGFELANATIAPIPAYTYTGSKIKPTVSVTMNGKVLKKNKAYTVTYGTNKAVGEGTVTITGKGDYSGTQTVSFKINPAAVYITKAKAKKAKAVVSWKALKLAENVASYRIRYRETGTTAWTTLAVSKNISSITVKGLAHGQTYQFQARAVSKVNGVTYVGAFGPVFTSAAIK
jgi:hypothetical protein